MKKSVLEIKDLEFGYGSEGNSWRLRVDDLVVGEGQRVLLRGPSGSGKSTLLSLVAGVLNSKKGSTRVLDVSPSEMGASFRDKWRVDHMGFVFQNFNLIPYLSVEENLTVPLGFSPRRREIVEQRGGVLVETERLLKKVGLSEEFFKKKYPAELSVGQQQRVALARALLGQPEIVLADEPTSALDQSLKKSFMDLLLEELTEYGGSLFMVSHDDLNLDLFDKVYVVESSGRVVLLGGET